MFIIFAADLPPGFRFVVACITPNSHLFERKGDALPRFLSGGIVFSFATLGFDYAGFGYAGFDYAQPPGISK